MREVIADTSVIVKWFHDENEAEVSAARAVLEAHTEELVTIRALDLVYFELGNLMLRGLRWTASYTLLRFAELSDICGEPLSFAKEWRPMAARIAENHKLSYYDACFVAAAHALKAPLITADKKLLAAEVGESPTAFAGRFGLV